jgi:hypothetical protein
VAGNCTSLGSFHRGFQISDCGLAGCRFHSEIHIPRSAMSPSKGYMQMLWEG